MTSILVATPDMMMSEVNGCRANIRLKEFKGRSGEDEMKKSLAKRIKQLKEVKVNEAHENQKRNSEETSGDNQKTGKTIGE